EQHVRSTYYDAPGDETVDVYSRESDSDGWGRRLTARLAYTEPLGERGMLQFDYAPTVSADADDREAFRLDPATGAYTLPDAEYTSASDGRVVTQRGGVSYQHRTERLRASVGLDLQSE